jgi:hypothetical protein
MLPFSQEQRQVPGCRQACEIGRFEPERPGEYAKVEIRLSISRLSGCGKN